MNAVHSLRCCALLAAAAAITACSPEPEVPPEPPPAPEPSAYEVWIIDQSDSRGLDHGGTLHVYHSDDLRGREPTTAEPADVVDLAGDTAALCDEQTGAKPVRPHMILFNSEQTHAMVAFVASGHVVMYETASRRPVSCLRMAESPTGQQAHAAFPAPDGSYVLVANQNGKLLERIDTDFAQGRFIHNREATLDLANCTTPNGEPCQTEALRPDNAPICPVISDDGALAFVTLRGGGLLVVDPRTTPMAIVAEYDRETVKGNGCGGIQVGEQIYVNSGGRPAALEHLHPHGFEVYRFARQGFAGEAPLPPNAPAPVVVFSAEGARDSHGMVDTGNGRYLWVFDRHADVAEVFATADDRHVRTLSLTGEHTGKAAPDLTDISPDGQRVYVAFRGPTPLSGDPHSATGETPGLAIMEVLDDGGDGRLLGIIPMSNVGEDGVERADPHGLRVRRLE